jgi:chemotaxis protein methyltransferase CheR
VIKTIDSVPPLDASASFATPPITLTAKEFSEISSLARTEFGLELGKGKEQLVAARLGKKMRQLGINNFRDYRRHVAEDTSGEALMDMIDALTTNHTSFFREPAHFDFLNSRIFPEWRSHAPMRIWSAASSSGEEPYSIAMAAREHLGTQSAALPRILATDISTRVLDTARKGLYKAERFGGEPAPWLRKHLLRGEGRWDGWYRMRDEVLGMVEFRRINLIESLGDLPKFAVIFCRNVMIYFSRQTQEDVVNRLTSYLEPGGYLFIGHAESLTGIKHSLEPVQPAIYRKRGGR